jgi:protein-S-isoprenylcysteine O-methyltransferase Ste14
MINYMKKNYATHIIVLVILLIGGVADIFHRPWGKDSLPVLIILLFCTVLPLVLIIIHSYKKTRK